MAIAVCCSNFGASSCCSGNASISASHGVAGCGCEGFQRCVPPLESHKFKSEFGSASKLARRKRQAQKAGVVLLRLRHAIDRRAEFEQDANALGNLPASPVGAAHGFTLSQQTELLATCGVMLLEPVFAS